MAGRKHADDGSEEHGWAATRQSVHLIKLRELTVSYQQRLANYDTFAAEQPGFYPLPGQWPILTFLDPLENETRCRGSGPFAQPGSNTIYSSRSIAIGSISPACRAGQ